MSVRSSRGRVLINQKRQISIFPSTELFPGKPRQPMCFFWALWIGDKRHVQVKLLETNCERFKTCFHPFGITHFLHRKVDTQWYLQNEEHEKVGVRQPLELLKQILRDKSEDVVLGRWNVIVLKRKRNAQISITFLEWCFSEYHDDILILHWMTWKAINTNTNGRQTQVLTTVNQRRAFYWLTRSTVNDWQPQTKKFVFNFTKLSVSSRELGNLLFGCYIN